MLPNDHALSPGAVSSTDIPQFEMNNAPASDQHIKTQRRRTLQTITELASQHTTDHVSTGSPSWASSALTTYGSPGITHTKSSRRRSLPVQGIASHHDYNALPTRSTGSAAGPPLHRSGLAASNSQGNSRNNPRRRSMPSSFETRGRSLSPVAEGELSKQPLPGGSQASTPSRNRSGRKQVSRMPRGTEQQAGGWNAHRERELIKREQALIESNARRTRERLGLAIGSPAALPSATPRPGTDRDDCIAQQARYYSSLPLLKKPPSAEAVRRNSRGRNGRQVNGTIIDGRLFLDVDPNNARNTIQQHQLRRTVSATSEPQGTSYQYTPDQGQMAPLLRSVSSGPLLSPTLIDRQLIEPSSSSSLHTSSTSTHSSSTKSSVSSNTTTRPTQRPPLLMHSRSSDHPLRQNPVSSTNIARSTSGTGSITPGLASPDCDTSLPPPLSHAFLGAHLVAQTSFMQPTLTPLSVPPRHQRSLSRSSHGSSQSHHTPPSTTNIGIGVATSTLGNDIIYRENPDKRGLGVGVVRSVSGNSSSSRHSRNVVVRRAAREEAERRSKREKVRERVRRANEMEERRKRELVEEKGRNKMVGAKREKNGGFLCGLFGRCWGEGKG